MRESCREWVDEIANKCNRPAVVILWGKLFPAEALGPRCPEHAEKHLGRYYVDAIREHWAIFDLRNLTRETDR